MVEEPLVYPDDLTGFPGAPFSSTAVAAAAGVVRDAAEWHIAPRITETREIETGCARVVLLPSLLVHEVTEVRDAETGEVLAGWRLRKTSNALKRASSWPEVVEVDMVHGHEECPPGLLPVIAERAQRAKAGLVRQENVGARSVAFAQTYDSAGSTTLARYSLPSRP